MSVVTKQLSSGDDWSIDENPDVLTRIYDSAVSIAVWQRQVQQDAQRYLAELLQKQTTISLKLSGSPEQLMKEIQKAFPQGLGDGQGSIAGAAAFYADAHQVLEMFACLFDAKAHQHPRPRHVPSLPYRQRRGAFDYNLSRAGYRVVAGSNG